MTFVIIYAFPSFNFPFSKIKKETISDSREELVKVSWSVTACGHFHLYLWGFVTQTRTVFFLFFCFVAGTFSRVHGEAQSTLPGSACYPAPPHRAGTSILCCEPQEPLRKVTPISVHFDGCPARWGSQPACLEGPEQLPPCRG